MKNPPETRSYTQSISELCNNIDSLKENRKILENKLAKNNIDQDKIEQGINDLGKKLKELAKQREREREREREENSNLLGGFFNSFGFATAISQAPSERPEAPDTILPSSLHANEETYQNLEQHSSPENIITKATNNLEHAKESFFECFAPKPSSRNEGQSEEQPQPSSVIENIGNDLNRVIKKTQNETSVLGKDMLKLFMIDQLFKTNKDSQNR
jgi:hypothetical protein